MKLVVEVVGAHDLPSKRGRVTPFVRVAFGGQRHATGAVVRPGGETNPTWNETVVFVVDAVSGSGSGGGGGRLSDRSIDVGVYHRRSSGGRSCLGRVRLFGAAVAPSAAEAVLLRCPLDRPGFFSPARGEVALRLYLAPYGSPPSAAVAAAWVGNNAFSSTYATSYNDTASSSMSMAGGPETVVGGASTQSSPAMLIKKKKKKKEQPPVQLPLPPPPPPAVHVFNAIPTQSSTGSLIFPPPPPPPPPSSMPPATKKAAAAAPATVDDAKAAEYLMVDKLEFLYVNVVRARGLDLTLGIDPYVEVRVGNYSAVTRHRVRNHEPEWNQVFAFSKEHLQADTVEVLVKDKNLIVWDSVVGRASLPIAEVPVLAPPNRPLAPQWYFLKGGNGKGKLTGGEVMVAAWKGSQSDEAFAGALHAGAHDLQTQAAVAATQTKCYFAPRLCYLRCHVIAAQDLVHPAASADRRMTMNVVVWVQLGGAQRWQTRPSQTGKWDEDFFLVAAWPFEEPLEIAVVDLSSPERHEVLGQLTFRKGMIKVQQFDKKKSKPPPPAWYDLEPPRSSSLSDHGDVGTGGGGDGGRDGGGRRRHEFRSKIQLRVYYDAAYHVLDEVSTYASDFQPSARPLRSPAVGVLELAVLKATGLPRSTTSPYCVAKYGPKWVRTRTLLASTSSSPPSWQEQFTFDVFDPCTVLTVAVFDNRQLQQLSSTITDNNNNNNNNNNGDDVPLGKVRIRVSTLLSGRTYEHPYSLFTLTPAAGLLRCGELHLAVRFTHTTAAAWLNMMSMYLRPPLPNQHFAKPIPTHLIPRLRRAAADVVASRLARAEPPLLPAAVHYLLRDPAAHPNPHVAASAAAAYSTRRSHAACARLRDVVAPLAAFARWFGGVREWESPVTTALVVAVFLVLTWMPRHILPTFFLYLFTVGVWNFCRRWRRPERPPQMEHYGDGVPPAMLADEFDAGLRLGTTTTTSPEAVLQWYWQLQRTAVNVQGLIGDVASVGERVHAVLEWKDGRATVIALTAVAALGAVTYAVPFKVLVSVTGVYVMRHPLLRRKKKEPSPLMSFFRRLPSNVDVML